MEITIFWDYVFFPGKNVWGIYVSLCILSRWSGLWSAMVNHLRDARNVECYGIANAKSWRMTRAIHKERTVGIDLENIANMFFETTEEQKCKKSRGSFTMWSLKRFGRLQIDFRKFLPIYCWSNIVNSGSKFLYKRTKTYK